VAKNLAYVVGPISRLMGPNVANFSSTDSSWPKTDNIYPHLAILRRSGGETRNTSYGSADYDYIIRGGEGSSSPPELWIVEVTCIKLSLVLHWYSHMSCLSWAVYHDCDHICITPMVDLLFVRWFMRCKHVYVFYVW
jgi:hypothetical protein